MLNFRFDGAEGRQDGTGRNANFGVQNGAETRAGSGRNAGGGGPFGPTAPINVKYDASALANSFFKKKADCDGSPFLYRKIPFAGMI